MSTNGLFDDLVDTTTEAPKTDTPTPATEPVTEAPKTEETKSETPAKAEETPRETITVESLEELPDGYVDIKGFAWELTKKNMEAAVSEGRTPGPDDMVDTQAVYAATRGKRWSLPAREAVTADGTKLGLVIDLAEGVEAWEARPERGTGTGGAAMTPARRATRILRAGKAKAQLDYWTKRVKRYGELLAEVNATWEDADEAYNQYLETEDGKKEIPDSDKDE